MELGFSKVAFALMCVMAFAMVAQAQNTPQDFLAAHNTARAAVGVGPLTWDPTVADYAQNYANSKIGTCESAHSSGSYGENLFLGPDKEWSAGEAVASWVGENQWYDYNSNTCSAPAGKSCGHYTQVVWRSSTQLGCARVKCDSGDIFITCNYNPPGNYVGERPY